MKVSDDFMTDNQYDGLLIEFLYDLEEQRELAVKENAMDTVKKIDKTIEKTKRKLTTN